MPTFANSKAPIAYLDNASQPLGGLNQGMGYPADIDPATVTNGSFMGGAAATIKYQAGTSAPVSEPVQEKPVKAKK